MNAFCFNRIMESVVNSNMKNPSLNVGILIPPDRFYKPVLYSDEQASRNFNRLEHDIYHSVKKSKKLNERKTPKSVFAVLGTCVLALCFPKVKKLFR